MAQTIGPVTVETGYATQEGAKRFTATLAGVSLHVEALVSSADVRVRVRVLDAELPGDVLDAFETEPQTAVPVTGSVDGDEIHIGMTLPRRQDAGWST
jgi:hypothetical protein